MFLNEGDRLPCLELDSSNGCENGRGSLWRMNADGDEDDGGEWLWMLLWIMSDSHRGEMIGRCRGYP